MAGRTGTEVIYQGILYPSYTALGRAFGLCAATTKRRIEKKIPLDQKLATNLESRRLARKATSWGSSRDFIFR